MTKKTWKYIGIVLNFVVIIGLLIYCFVLTQDINKQAISIEKQAISIEEQNASLQMLQVENMVQIDLGFQARTGVGGKVTLPTELNQKDLSFYITEYKGSEIINEQLISKQAFIDTSPSTSDYYIYFKVLINEGKNKMQYSIAVNSESRGGWAVNVPTKISPIDYTTAIDDITASSGGFLALNAENKYIMEQMTFGEYKVVVYVSAE